MNNCSRYFSNNGNFLNNILPSQNFTNTNNSNICGCMNQNSNNMDSCVGTNQNPSNLDSCGCVNQNANNNCENNCTNEDLLDSLCNCIGRRCTCEFETQDGLESKTGILERIGNNYLRLRSLNSNRVIYCCTCNLLFVTIIC